MNFPLAASSRLATVPRLWLFFTLAAGAAMLWLADPYSSTSWLPPCPFHAITGLYCPGCGTTRALHSLVHGDPVAAIRMNLLAVLAIPLLPILSLHRSNARPAWFALLADARPWLLVVVGFAILRNLPWMPFAWLAPG